MKTAEEILRSNVSRDCIWEDMKNLTNTPIRDVVKAMEEYAQQRVEEATRWIPVKLGGEYPEYMETVIIHAELGFVGQAQFGGSTTHPVFSIGDEWHKATHWQPLPKAPTV